MIGLLRHSLSLRLLAIFLLLAALFAWGVVSGIRWAYREDDLRTLISGHLSLHIDYVKQDLGTPPRPERAQAITERVPVDLRIEGPDLHWASDARFPALTDLKFGPSEYFSSAPGALLNELKGVDFAVQDDHHYFRFQQGGYDVVVVTPKIGQHATRPPLVPILVGFALFLVLCGYLAVRALFLPVATIRAGAAYIGAGHFGHRIRTGRNDELGELADDINLMAGKVEGMLDAKRQLLLGVSHELRSPLSRMKLALALQDDSTSVQGLKQDVDEMRSVVDSLLDAERLGSAHSALDLSDVALDDLVRELVERYFPDTARLHVSVPPGVSVRLDRPRIQLLLKNLVGNALRYAPPESGPVQLTVTVDDDAIEFRVRDQGPGLTAEQRAHLGEPFYRPDSSRTRDTGGTGLGLYLSRQVARAHGGDLRLADADGPGTEFIVRLPRRR